MQIRHITENDDRYAISHVYEESWKYSYKDIIPQSYLDSIPKGRWADAIDNPEMHSLIMLKDEKIIGTSSYCKSRLSDMEEYGEIVSIYLLPEYIGKGYGKLLFKSAVNELKKLGFNDIFLWVLDENHRARRFYEKEGFTLSGRYLEVNIGGKDLIEVQYVLYGNYKM